MKIENMDLKNYKCHDCKWIGNEEALDWDTTETCMGLDKVEMCPECGSLNISLQHQQTIRDINKKN